MISHKQIQARKNMLSPSAYVHRFSSLDMAFQQMFADVLNKTRQAVIHNLHKELSHVEEFNDYLVIEESLSMVIQPSVPVPHGYGAYWSFRPDKRSEIDMTLGVPLSNNDKYEILGYLAFPRLLHLPNNVRLFSTSDSDIELYGYEPVQLIKDLL
jgi:hypothetical protein